jgi:hypothetical protein
MWEDVTSVAVGEIPDNGVAQLMTMNSIDMRDVTIIITSPQERNVNTGARQKQLADKKTKCIKEVPKRPKFWQCSVSEKIFFVFGFKIFFSDSDTDSDSTQVVKEI